MSRDTELQLLITAEDRSRNAFTSASSNVRRFDDDVTRMGGSLKMAIAGAVAGVVTLDAAIRGISSGIKKAEWLRDLSMMLERVDGSSAAAVKSLDYFNAAQERTRRTGDDLAKVYADLLPQAMAKGFSRARFREVVVQLDQVATAVGRMPSEINEAFAQILSGRTRETNPILRALGIDSESIKSGKVGIDELLKGMSELAGHGEAMGDNIASAWEKANDAMLESFAAGFNEARGKAEEGMEGVVKAIASPEVLGALSDVGKVVAQVGPLVATGFGGALKVVTFNVGAMMAAVGSAASGVALAVETAGRASEQVFSGLAAQAERHPAIARMLGINTAAVGGLRSMGTFYRDVADVAGTWGADAADLAVSGAQIMAGFYDKMSGSAAIVAGEAAKTDDRLKSIATSAGETAKASEIAARALASMGIATRTGYTGLESVNPAINDATLAMMRFRQRDAFDSIYAGTSDWTSGASLNTPEQRQRSMADAVKAIIEMQDEAQERAIGKWRESFDELRGTLGDAALDFAETGGRNLGEIAAYHFSRLAGQGFESIFSSLFGPTQDAQGNWTFGGVNYGADKAAAENAASSTGRTQTANAAFGFASIGLGAYQGSLTADGQRTSGTISGGMAGAGIGAQIGAAGGPIGALGGAIIGLVVGAIGSYLGEKERQDKYKFVDPSITSGGRVGLGAYQEIEAGERQQIIADIAERYQWSRNSAVRILQSLGMQPTTGTFGSIDASIQPNPSASMMKHLSEWMAGTLPDTVLGQVKSQVGTGLGKVGVGEEQFSAIWNTLNQLSPEKMVSILTGLGDVLKSFDESVDFFDTTRAPGKRRAVGPQAPINSFYRAMQGERGRMDMSYGAQMDEDFTKILELQGYLDDFVGEDQIQYARQIADIMQQAREKELAIAREILAAQDAIDRSVQSYTDKYTLMGFVNSDGSPNLQAQADYLQKRADQELQSIWTSSNATDVQKNFDEFMGFVDQIVALGYQLNPETGEMWRKWALDQLKIGESASDTRLGQLGDEVSEINEKFIEQFKPGVAAFIESIGQMQDAIDGGAGGGGGRDPLNPTLTALADNVTLTSDSMGSLSGVIKQLTSDVATLSTTINNVVSGNFGTQSSSRSSGASAFVAATVAGRR